MTAATLPTVDVDVDALLTAEIEPCPLRVTLTGLPAPTRCGRPAAVIVHAHCAGCGLRVPIPVCTGHHALLTDADRVSGGMDCSRCGAPHAITFGTTS